MWSIKRKNPCMSVVVGPWGKFKALTSHPFSLSLSLYIHRSVSATFSPFEKFKTFYTSNLTSLEQANKLSFYIPKIRSPFSNLFYFSRIFSSSNQLNVANTHFLVHQPKIL